MATLKKFRVPPLVKALEDMGFNPGNKATNQQQNEDTSTESQEGCLAQNSNQEQVNLIPRATCDPARDGPRSHEAGGHRKVLPFDWWTAEQQIFVNYYDYAALIPSQLQRTLNDLEK